MAKLSATIEKLTFSDGNEIRLSPKDKIIIVGPNNSGKSQALREIVSLSRCETNTKPLVVTDVEITKVGSRDDLLRLFENEGRQDKDMYYYESWALQDHQIQYWDKPNLRGNLIWGFMKKIAADDRLQICAQQASISPSGHKSKPQHILYDNDLLMNKISTLFKRAFGKDLMFDFRGGSHLPIHVGQLPGPEAGHDRVSDPYVRAVRNNPLLDKQGDGMKSYAGILFEAVVADRDMTLIDEPEAFLHPPQMRRLGETLSAEVNGQLLVATHSSDILRGFLEGTQGNVRILRIRRDGDINVVYEAVPAVIKELWEKPELRYSNALEGVFHEQTIICEDDSDCRLINAVADHISSTSATSLRDTAYVPTGGKHGIPKIAASLRQIGVPVKAVFDIDFLVERDLVQSTVEAFGGHWNDFEQLWRQVDAEVRDGVKAKSAPEIKADIISILEKSGNEEIPKGNIIEAFKQSKPWSCVKKYGARAIPNGQAQTIYNSLIEKLEFIGIFLVPVGEIENFCPEIGSHGPKFVTKLLSTISLDDPRLMEARQFIEKVHAGNHGKLE